MNLLFRMAEFHEAHMSRVWGLVELVPPRFTAPMRIQSWTLNVSYCASLDRGIGRLSLPPSGSMLKAHAGTAQRVFATMDRQHGGRAGGNLHRTRNPLPGMAGSVDGDVHPGAAEYVFAPTDDVSIAAVPDRHAGVVHP